MAIYYIDGALVTLNRAALYNDRIEEFYYQMDLLFQIVM